MSDFRRCSTALPLLALFAGVAVAQVGPPPPQCSSNLAMTIRGEGFTEQTADIMLSCTGGAAPTLGSAIPQVNITVFYNAPVTSRLLPQTGVLNASEALLLIDEPGSGVIGPVPGFGSQAKQNLCTTPLQGCVEFVSQTAGSSIPVATDSPQGTAAATPGKNVFQGVVTGNSVTFFGVPILAPGVTGSRFLRISNVRVDAMALSGGSATGTTLGTPVIASISISGPTWLLLSTPTPTVAFVRSGLTTSASPAPGLSQCSSQTMTPATTLSFAENIFNAFKTRVAAQDDLPYAGQNGTPGLNGFAAQNVPSIYLSESGIILPIAAGQTAGLTDFGTRLKAQFNNVPAGVRLFVSVSNVLSDALPVPIPAVPGGRTANVGPTGFAQLTAGETAAFSAVAATNTAPGTSGSVPVTEIPVVNGAATAVWEVINTDPATIKNLKFAVYASYTANPALNRPAPGTVTVNLSYAAAPPSFTAGAAPSGTLPVPRFIADANVAKDVLTISAGTCAPSLSASKVHSGNFTQGQTGATYTVTVSNTGTAGTSGAVIMTETVPVGLTLVSMAGAGWACGAGNTCTRGDALAAGTGYPAITVTVNVAAGAASPQVNSVSVTGGGSAPATASDSTIISGVAAIPPVLSIAKAHSGSFIPGQTAATYTVAVSNQAGAGNSGGTVTVTETVPTGMTLVSMAGTGWTCPAGGSTCARSDVLNGGGSFPTITVTVNVALNASALVTNLVSVSGGGSAAAAASDPTTINAFSAALRFVPVTPCRVTDTRNAAGPFGGPAIGGGATRSFNIPASACGVPASALAYAFNVTVVPSGPLGFLTLWPAGQTQPLASTLNSDGRIKANAAIVPAGTGGAVSVFVTDPTQLILDINGYFVPATDPAGLAFFPITPCRIADTRNAVTPLGGPSMGGGQSRTFPALAGTCGVPATAKAYSLNFTAVPGGGPLGFLTAWPTGQARPLASSLNAPTGTVAANAAIVPAGAGGSIDVFTSNATNLVIDIDGYFAPMAAGGLSLFGVTPCRVVDTRLPAGSLPILSTRNVAVSASACGIPDTAQAHVFNVTVVPPGVLGFLTLWPQGQIQPLASTLNAQDAAITSNMAIVPANNGSISVFTSNLSHVILDIIGFFGQ